MAEEFLTCYRVLHANEDGRAAQVLTTIYDQVQASAARIGDEEMQRSFLEKVPAHRKIVAAWRSLQDSHSDGSTDDATVVS